MGKILGIDLGTTNCCVSVVEGATPQVLTNREGSRTTPSIVGFTEDGERLVGQIAKRQAITNPMNTVFAVKRLVGRKYEAEETQHAREVLPYEIVRAVNGDVKIRARAREYSPEEISAFILREIKEFSEEALGEEITEAIITVPAYFDDAQRQATRDAGRIAGLEVLRIINEPTAASLAYGLDRKGSETVAVYDLGGGTFDISILQLGDGIYEVKATAGDTYLGGEDFDKKIMDWLLDDFRKSTGIDLRQDRMALQRLKEAAEKAKCELSTATETTTDAAVHLGRRLRTEAHQPDADARALRVARGGPDRSHRRAMPRCARGGGSQALRRGPGDPRRRTDAHAEGPADGRRALRARAQPRHQPGRGRRHRSGDPGRRPEGRDQGRRAARRHARSRSASRCTAASSRS